MGTQTRTVAKIGTGTRIGFGTGTGTGVGTPGRIQDGNGMEAGTETRAIVEMGMGTRMGTRIGSERAEERLRNARNLTRRVDAVWKTGEKKKGWSSILQPR